MQKTTYAFWMLLLSVVLAGSLAILGPAESKQARASAPRLTVSLTASRRCFSEYATTTSTSHDAKLIEGAIKGMLSDLDPHSFYMNAQEFSDLRMEESGKFGGVGIEATMENGLLKIVAPIEGSPAAKAGILPGDLITAIDGDDTHGMSLDDAVQRMRGPVKVPVTLSIARSGASDSFDVRLVREVIQVVPVKYEIESRTSAIFASPPSTTRPLRS